MSRVISLEPLAPALSTINCLRIVLQNGTYVLAILQKIGSLENVGHHDSPSQGKEAHSPGLQRTGCPSEGGCGRCGGG